MKEIKIKFEIEEYFINFFVDKFSDKYKFIISDKPDFVVLGAGTWHKCFQYDCVRILIIGENIRPDFNLFDYACGFDKMEFGDRYLYYPLYCDVKYREETMLAIEKHKCGKIVDDKKKFCNFVVSNGSNADPIREDFFHVLNNYLRVDSAGSFLNNMPEKWTVPKGADEISEMNRFREAYRFSLVFENSRYPGYTTEKIVRAFMGGTIPIYWGDPDIKKQFNPESFIDITDFGSFDDAVNYIKEVNENSEMWKKMLKEPILLGDSKVPNMIKDSYILNFFEHIFEQGHKALRRTNRKNGWGYHYENQCRIGQEMQEDRFLNMVYRVKKKVKNLSR